ncbi:hypothetical protein KKF91_20090 [Myxococcota bacterium]|nr:hypothetical protein [Myxococcota bacterium]MBU1432847.1 hypothetical protein [Myxococcota bacterium]MBU1897531.1 hypothetical protein [Myxococcota bacterium]
MDHQQTFHIIILATYLIIALFELFLYLNMSEKYAKLISRFKFKFDLSPIPFAKLDLIVSLPNETENAVIYCDIENQILIARRSFFLGAKRMPAIVYLRFFEKDDGLYIKARWGYIPFLIGISIYVLGVVFLISIADQFDQEKIFPMILGWTLSIAIINGIWFLMGRHAAQTILNEIDQILIESIPRD